MHEYKDNKICLILIAMFKSQLSEIIILHKNTCSYEIKIYFCP